MRKTAVILPVLALLAGAAGFILRTLEVGSVFDELTGLAERGAPVTLALIALSAAVVLASLVFSLVSGIGFTSPRGFENAFGPLGVAYPLSFAALGIVWLAATAAHILGINSAGSFPIIEVYYSVLSALSAISILLFAIEIYKDPSRKSVLVLSVVPSLFMCFCLILLYKRNASNPSLLSYCYQCLAIISAALSFYFTAGFVYNKAAPGKTVFSYLITIFFCSVALADNIAIGTRLIFAVIIVLHFLHFVMLVRNLQRKKASDE